MAGDADRAGADTVAVSGPPRLLPGMLERRRGAILNVASTAAFQPGPNQAVYCATRAYVLSFTEALAAEARGSGVRVSCLAPGATDTGFASQADMAARPAA